MQEPEQIKPATVPAQPEANAPMKKGRPVLYILVGVIALIGITNLSSFVSGKGKEAPRSAMPMRPSAANPQQVSSFQNQQALQTTKDQEDRARQQQVTAAQLQQMQAEQSPGPEADGTAPMTPAQRQAIYGNSPNAPKQTSNASQAQAEAKQRLLAREKQHQDALNSDTVAIDFSHQTGGPAAGAQAPTQTATAATDDREEGSTSAAVEIAQAADQENPQRPATLQNVSDQRTKAKTDPMAGYDFDEYDGRLYRVFEGTVLEGVVTNHIDGGFAGPILVMLTTDYYSHDHQQLLMPQGTRLIGNVQSVGNAQQRKMFVTFHRAVCPDGFSLDLDKYIGLDPLGTTGLATNVDHGYLQAFGAAAAVGGLGGLAQIGNSGSILSPSTQIQNGISAQSSQEAEQILNHFLNRLPIITLKEGSRARVYIGRDILIPSYAEHRVNPAL
jgi:type IV secretory pathway VirB10-like protein